MSSPLLEQTSFECDLLAHIAQAVRRTLDWGVADQGFARKLSTVRFVIHSFQRHLERLLDLEEEPEYLDLVGLADQGLAPAEFAGREEHDAFRHRLADIVPRLQRLDPSDQTGFAALADDLRELLDRVDDHCLRQAWVAHEPVGCGAG
jgi:hypothetical protein